MTHADGHGADRGRRPSAAVAVPVGEGEFTLALPVFEGPLQLLLHLIESRQLDVLTVPLAEVADAYVGAPRPPPGRRGTTCPSSSPSPRS